MNKIKIEPDIEISVEAEDNATAKIIEERLPVASRAMRWGDEIYFDTGIEAPLSGATMDLEVGDIAYWPQGMCLCIFFGRTPASTTDKPAPASEVVIVGKAQVDPAALRKVKQGAKVTVI